MVAKRNVTIINGEKRYQCTGCERYLLKEDFNKNRLGYDGIMSQCKECLGKKMKQYKIDNREKRNRYQKEYGERRISIEGKASTTPQSQPQPQITSSPQDNDVANLENAFPDAYTKIMSDQDMKEAYEKWSYDYKIKYLTDMQDKINKQKEEEKFKDNVKKFRALAEQAFTEDGIVNELKMNELEEIVKGFALEKDKERYINAMVKFSPLSFKLSWKNVYEEFSGLKE